MVYDKYIEKNGKLYGPYTYHSKRINGKVISEYHGSKKEFNLNFLWLFIGIFLLIILILGFVFFNSKLSGNVVLNLNSGNQIIDSNVLSFSLTEGELLPADSKVVFDVDNKKVEYNLNELVEGNFSEGNFYVKGKSLTGNGKGYGIEGIKKIYPRLDFELEILKESESNSEIGSDSDSIDPEDETPNKDFVNDTESSEPVDEPMIDSENQTVTEDISSDNDSIEPIEEEKETVQDNEVADIITEEGESVDTVNINEQDTETPQDNSISVEETSSSDSSSSQESLNDASSSSESTSESTSESDTSSITGGVIKNFFLNIFGLFGMTGQATLELQNVIEGKVSFEEQFNYNLNEGETARIKSGSVKINGESVDDSLINLDLIDGKVVVTTDYSLEEKGFGGDYLGNLEKEFFINLSKIGLQKDDNLKVTFLYEDEELTFIDDEKSQNLNETEIPELNVTDNMTEIQNESLNEFIIGVLSDEEKAILINEFGNVSVKITRAEKIKDRIEVTFEIEDYSVDHSYDAELSKEELSEWIEKDKIRFLKDIVSELSIEKPPVSNVEGIIGDYRI